MFNIRLFLILLLFPFLVVGCQPKSSNRSFDPDGDSPLLTPFAGHWVFEFEKTLAAEKAAGVVTDEQIAGMRKLFADNPQLRPMHADLTMRGNVAIGSGIVSCEYRFFGMHNHDSKVCGKAWHHEDRFDPGDMSKCYVRLSVVGGDLHLEVHMLDGPPDPDDNDPDFGSTLSVEGELSKCDAAKQTTGAWDVLVFSRRS